MIINTKEEFEAFYPYKNKTRIKYPKEYPCICKIEQEGGGLMGEYWQIYVIYYPNFKALSVKQVFHLGLNASWNKI